MAKLYFRYGVMGSSKTAQALMTRFNYLETGNKVLLIKPAVDNRDGKNILRSRIGLEAPARVIEKDDNIFEIVKNELPIDAVISDESHFFTKSQIVQLKDITAYLNIPVFCYGLRTDFRMQLFEGSEALFALADSITEIKSICRCGEKASVNARISPDGKVITGGPQVFIGGNESYEPMCYKCWKEKTQ